MAAASCNNHVNWPYNFPALMLEKDEKQSFHHIHTLPLTVYLTEFLHVSAVQKNVETETATSTDVNVDICGQEETVICA